MLPEIIEVPGLPPANATYSQATILGELVFVSGQLGINPVTGQLAQGGIQAQTRQAIENIITILSACGSSLDRVAKVTLFLADFTLLAEANQIYAQYFTHRPAKTGVGIDQLWGGALIEIEVIASRG